MSDVDDAGTTIEETMMRRTTALLATTTLAVATLAACADGGTETTTASADEPAADEPETTDPPTTEPATDEPAADEPATDEPAADEPAADEPATDEPAADEPATDEPAADDGGPSGPAIDSIADVPPQCRAVMADYLQDLEPIVAPIDWNTATLNDFNAVAADFEALSTEFDAGSAEAGCDDLDFAEDDDGLELVIEFAGDVAPGTVPFLEFLSSFLGPTDVADDGDEGAIDGCDDAIAAVRSLMDQYDSLAEVPVADMMVLTELGAAMMTCTPEQLEFLGSDAVTEFLGD